MPSSFRLIIALSIPTVALLLGCGNSGRVPIKGALLEKGVAFTLDASKLKLPKGATAAPPGSEPPLRVVFISEDKEQFAAKVDPNTGTFSVDIKPGKYKISVTASMGAPGAKGGDSLDLFSGHFGPQNTPIVREVKAGEDVVIDLSKPQG